MRRVLSAVLLAALLLTASALGEEAPAPGYATPEAAVEAFCAAFTAGDFDGAMAACCAREMADGFDLPANVDRVGAFMPYTYPAPAASETYRDLNYAGFLGALASQYKMLCYGFFVTDGMDGHNIAPADAVYAEAFQEAVDPANLARLTLVRVDPPRKDALESAENVKTFDKEARGYGAAEKTERIVLWELDGRYFVSGFTLYRYEGGWKIAGLVSSLAGVNIFGAPTEATEAEYLDML